MAKTLLSVGEAAERLGVSAATVRRWEGSGALVAIRSPGNQRLFRAVDVDALLTFPDEPTDGESAEAAS